MKEESGAKNPNQLKPPTTSAGYDVGADVRASSLS